MEGYIKDVLPAKESRLNHSEYSGCSLALDNITIYFDSLMDFLTRCDIFGHSSSALGFHRAVCILLAKRQ